MAASHSVLTLTAAGAGQLLWPGERVTARPAG